MYERIPRHSLTSSPGFFFAHREKHSASGSSENSSKAGSKKNQVLLRCIDTAAVATGSDGVVFLMDAVR